MHKAIAIYYINNYGTNRSGFTTVSECCFFRLENLAVLDTFPA